MHSDLHMDVFAVYTYGSSGRGNKSLVSKTLTHSAGPLNFFYDSLLCTDCCYLKSLCTTDFLEFICLKLNFYYWSQENKKPRCLEPTMSSGTKVVKREFLEVKLILMKFLVAFLEIVLSFKE